jgi:hypothetical protein
MKISGGGGGGKLEANRLMAKGVTSAASSAVGVWRSMA